ncbi:hypothetical protein B0H13DRAFT_1929244 [Mycena leptocephala]|nr:hypothetical protein B0H13DRAFT_1929244 [Mycena leptocephala]
MNMSLRVLKSQEPVGATAKRCTTARDFREQALWAGQAMMWGKFGAKKRTLAVGKRFDSWTRIRPEGYCGCLDEVHYYVNMPTYQYKLVLQRGVHSEGATCGDRDVVGRPRRAAKAVIHSTWSRRHEEWARDTAGVSAASGRQESMPMYERVRGCKVGGCVARLARGVIMRGLGRGVLVLWMAEKDVFLLLNAWKGLQQRDRRGEARRVVLSINEKRRRAGDSGNAKAATEIGLRGEILSQASVVLSAAWALEASGRIAETGLRSSGDVVRASWVRVSGSVDRRGTGRNIQGRSRVHAGGSRGGGRGGDLLYSRGPQAEQRVYGRQTSSTVGATFDGRAQHGWWRAFEQRSGAVERMWA